MSRARVITLFVTLLVGFLLILADVVIPRSREKYRTFLISRTAQAGRDLIAQNNSPLLPGAGLSLKQEVGKLLQSPTDVAEAATEDGPGVFGGRCVACKLALTNGHQQCLVIRLEWDPKVEGFHVRGFWTANSIVP